MDLHFLIPGSIHTLTGGYIYNKRVANGLMALGHNVKIHSLATDFPFASNESILHCRKVLGSIPRGEILIIDSLIFGAIPQLLSEIKPLNPIVALIHLPLSVNSHFCYDPEMPLSVSEKEAFIYGSQIIVTSGYTSNLLIQMGVDPRKVNIVIPGVDVLGHKTEYAKMPRKLITVSNCTRNKGFLLMFEALTGLMEFDWELNCYGNPGFDPEFMNELKLFIKNNNLSTRVVLHPPVQGMELSMAYVNADVLLHPSPFETYGMVLTEALAHGIPVVASTGGAIKNTVPGNMGLFFEADNKESLQHTLQLLLQDTNTYQSLCSEANKYINQAHCWDQTILEFEHVLKTC